MQSSSGARLKAYFRCPKSYKREFKEAKCALPISVGQRYHNGDEFAAIIERVNNTFKECTIIVCDSLQRYTIQMIEHCSEERAYKIAMEQGDYWLEKNYNIYNNLSIPYKIMRWDEWLSHSQYKLQKAEIENLYKFQRAFRDAICSTTKKFLIRYTAKFKNIVNKELIFHKSAEYMKEECAVTSLWFPEEDLDFQAYPGSQPNELVIAYKYFLKSNVDKILQWLSICFVKE